MKDFKIRLIIVNIFLILSFCILIGRLFQIQIINGVKYSQRSREQSKCRTIITAQRGNIRDRDGKILAKSISSQLLVKADMLTNNSKKLNKENNKKKKPITTIKRVYPYGELASTVLGYVGKDGYGLAGVEYNFDKYLRGENGWSIIQKDGRNNRYSRIGMPKKLPKKGHELYLTIDLQIQKIVENVLDQTVKQYKAKGGMCVVMDPVNGDILAMANKPDFNPNAWKLYTNNAKKNRCISYNYEPGSTFKIVTAAAVLQENILKENDLIDGNKGVYNIYNQVIRDHKAYGNITFSDALNYSSNVCFAKMADKLGDNRLYNYVKDFGFGNSSGICLPGEEMGIVHPIDKWSGRTRVTMAIGQEISTTLLHMMILFSSVANGGILIEPRIYSKIVDSEGSVIKIQRPKIKRRVLSSNVANRLRVMLQGVVEKGTAKKSAFPGITIGGKTGTSQKFDIENKKYSNNKVWSSFIGFAPVENPAFVCGILIDEPINGDYGGAVACPAFKQIIRQIISHPNLEYAEKLIDIKAIDSMKNIKSNKINLANCAPDLLGMEKEQAESFLSSEDIPYEIVGKGSHIAYQYPSGGSKFVSDSKLIIYTNEIESDSAIKEKELITIQVPDCVGKDLKDAINTLNLKGLIPFVSGAGIVRSQKPSFGAVISSAVPCTLVCSFEG